MASLGAIVSLLREQAVLRTQRGAKKFPATVLCRSHAFGCTLPEMAAFSAGMPKASQPIGCSTALPMARLKRATTSPMV